MASNKKPRKPYRPKRARAPSIIYRVAPELTEKDHRDIDLAALVRLDNIRRGNGTEEDVINVFSAVRACYVLSAAFESKKKIQELCRLAAGSLYAINRLIGARTDLRDAKDDSIFIEDFLTKPVQAVLEIYGEMTRSCDRATLVRSVRANLDLCGKVLNIEEGVGFMVEPEFDPDDDATTAIEGRPGHIYALGDLCHGYVRRNSEMRRNEFYVPESDTTIPITEKITLILDKPVSNRRRKNIGHYEISSKGVFYGKPSQNTGGEER